jgi:hypothetical protein
LVTGNQAREGFVLPDTHFFNVPLAVKYGQENSIILSNLCYWVKHNAQNNINFFEGRYWTYNTLSAFQKQFPYFSVSQIRTILANLKKTGAVITGNFNKRAFDRTLWYSVSDEVSAVYNGKSAPDDPPPPKPDAAPICGNSQMHLLNPANAFAESGGPIPDKNSSKNTDLKESTTTDEPLKNSRERHQDRKTAVAADPYIYDLKAAFSKIDPTLLFDEAFYLRARSILEKYGLDYKYLVWLYDFCRKKHPDDLTAYYFKVFCQESLINRFTASLGHKTSPPVLVPCPVCSGKHPQNSDCPSCGFSAADADNPKKIAAARFVFQMPDGLRASYQSDLAAVRNSDISFEQRIASLQAVYEKYHIPKQA